MFVGRKRDLQLLENEWNSPGFRTAVVYGRRHVGRKSLLKAFTSGKNIPIFRPHLLAGEHPNDFRKLRQIVKDLGLPATGKSFSALVGEIVEASRERKMGLVIDDFEYLLLQEPMFLSHLKKQMQATPDANVLFLFSTSSFKAAEHGFASYESRFLQQKTLYHELLPLALSESIDLLPNLPANDLCMLYGITAGMPGYLGLVSENLKASVDACFLQPEAPLFLEGEKTLLHDLGTLAPYAEMLSLLSVKPIKKSELTNHMKERGIRQERTLSLLGKLMAAHIVKRQTPLGENFNREAYFVEDPFLRFYCRFILPSRNIILSGKNPGMECIRSEIEKKFPQHMKYAFETVCRQWLEENPDLPFRPTHYGPWWKTDNLTKFTERISLTASSDNGERVFCSCHFGDAPFDDINALDALRSWSSRIPAEKRSYIFFANHGFTEKCRAHIQGFPGFRLVSIDDMFLAPSPSLSPSM